MDWVRLYHDMPTDPKWRVLALRSGQCISDVVAVYLYLLVDASRNTMQRGETQCNAQNRYEEIAVTFELEPEDVQRILTAMEGEVVKDGKLTGWQKRNPVREDKSTQRVKRWRETQRNTLQHGNAPRVDKNREEKKDTDRTVVVDRPRVEKTRAPKRRTSLPDNFPDDEAVRRAQAFWTSKHRMDLAHSVREEAEQFRDHHLKHGSTMADWPAAWRTWCRNALKFNRVERTHERKSNLLAGAELALAAVNRDGPGHHRGTVTVINPDGALGQSDEGGGGPALGRNVR